MGKLIEISVRGSVYYFWNLLDDNQLKTLQQFAKEFYILGEVGNEEKDDIIIERFVAAVQQTFCISLNRISVAAVLVIK